MRTRKRQYTELALIFFNTFLLLLTINIILWGTMYFTRRARRFDPIATFGKARVLKSYPGWKEEDVVALTREMTKLDNTVYEYEPFTQFRHRPIRGRYVNIDANGFRVIKNQGPWPPNPSAFNIFVFGGSTTFGVGVADDETIPSFLQEYAAACCKTPLAVYNFGRLGYFSTQEMLLFYRLLFSGAIPKVAIFVDGINDFHAWAGEPDLTAELKSLLESEQEPLRSLHDLPMWHAASSLRQWMAGRKSPQSSPDCSDAHFLAGVIRRLRTMEGLVDTLGDAFQVQSVFVLQPIPVYKYDLRYHFLNGLDYRRFFRYGDGAKYGYPVLAKMRGELETRWNFLWLADIQEGRTENFYVTDGLHYTSAFCREIARCVCEFMSQKGLFDSQKEENYRNYKRGHSFLRDKQ